MTGEWIRFIIVAILLIAGLIAFGFEVLGANRFKFVMNRMHAAGIGDTLGLLLVVLAMIVSSGLNLASLKILLVLVIVWFTSPVSTHFLGQVEYYTNPHIYRHVDRKIEKEERDGTDGNR